MRSVLPHTLRIARNSGHRCDHPSHIEGDAEPYRHWHRALIAYCLLLPYLAVSKTRGLRRYEDLSGSPAGRPAWLTIPQVGVSSPSLCDFPTPVRLHAWLWMRRPYGEPIRVAVMWSVAISLEAVDTRL